MEAAVHYVMNTSSRSVTVVLQPGIPDDGFPRAEKRQLNTIATLLIGVHHRECV
jgi:hypothetical protein